MKGFSGQNHFFRFSPVIIGDTELCRVIRSDGELLDYLSGDSPQLRDLPDQGKGEGGVLLNGELSESLETKSDSKTKQSNKNQRKC